MSQTCFNAVGFLYDVPTSLVMLAFCFVCFGSLVGLGCQLFSSPLWSPWMMLCLSYLHAMALVGACRLDDTEEEISGLNVWKVVRSPLMSPAAWLWCYRGLNWCIVAVCEMVCLSASHLNCNLLKSMNAYCVHLSCWYLQCTIKGWPCKPRYNSCFISFHFIYWEFE
jgi:hypothetical protein